MSSLPTIGLNERNGENAPKSLEQDPIVHTSGRMRDTHAPIHSLVSDQCPAPNHCPALVRLCMSESEDFTINWSHIPVSQKGTGHQRQKKQCFSRRTPLARIEPISCHLRVDFGGLAIDRLRLRRANSHLVRGGRRFLHSAIVPEVKE